MSSVFTLGVGQICFTLGACSKNGGICSCLFQKFEQVKCFKDQYVRARIVCLFLCSKGYDAPAQKVFVLRKEGGESKSKRDKFGNPVYIFY